MLERNNDPNWVPLLEYAVKKGVSLSTLRRYIKAEKIKYRLEAGKYFVWDEKKEEHTRNLLETELENTKIMLHQARKEIAELKTLLAFYEDQNPDGPSA